MRFAGGICRIGRFCYLYRIKFRGYERSAEPNSEYQTYRQRHVFPDGRTLRRRGRGYVENRGRNSLPDHRAAAYSLYIQSVVPQGEPFAARLVQRDRR